MQLFSHQQIGQLWLRRKSFALLADEMGLGKSAQIITASDALRPPKIIVLCPSIARFTWEREFEKFSLFSPSVELVLKRKQQLYDKRDVVVCSYDLLICPDIYYQLAAYRNTLLVLDESHFLKEPKSKRTQAVFGLKVDARTGLAARAAVCWAASGTPAPNYSHEFYSLLRAAKQVKCTYEAFQQRYTVTRQVRIGERRPVANKNQDQLRKLLHPIMLRRTKKEVFPDMPELIYSELPVDTSDANPIPYFPQKFLKGDTTGAKLKKEVTLADETLLEMLKELEDDPAAQVALLERDTKHNTTLQRYIGLCKIEAAAEWSEQFLMNNKDEKLVIFAIHRDVIESLRQRLRIFNPLIIYGGHSAEKKEKRRQYFMERYKHRIMICNIDAASTNIDLSAASNELFVEQKWSPYVNHQAAMRCHRLEVEKTVNAYFMSMRGTVDEAIARVMTRKLTEMTDIIEKPSIDERLGELL